LTKKGNKSVSPLSSQKSAKLGLLDVFVSYSMLCIHIYGFNKSFIIVYNGDVVINIAAKKMLKFGKVLFYIITVWLNKNI